MKLHNIWFDVTLRKADMRYEVFTTARFTVEDVSQLTPGWVAENIESLAAGIERKEMTAPWPEDLDHVSFEVHVPTFSEDAGVLTHTGVIWTQIKLADLPGKLRALKMGAYVLLKREADALLAMGLLAA